MIFKWSFSGSAEAGDLKVETEVKEESVEEKANLFEIATKKALRDERVRSSKDCLIEQIFPGYTEQYRDYLQENNRSTVWLKGREGVYPLLGEYTYGSAFSNYYVTAPEDLLTLDRLVKYLIDKLEESEEEHEKTT